MGMMVVANRGKGISGIKLEPDMPFDVRALKEHKINDFLTGTRWKDTDFVHEKELSLVQKAFVIGRLHSDYIYNEEKLRPEKWTPEDVDNEINGYYRNWDCYSVQSLAPIFEVEYGYPAGAFRSVCDYEDTTMLYLRVMFPFSNPEFVKRFSCVTEETMEKEMNEFMQNIAGKDKTYSVEICEEWWKD